jgi:hypothetical protein
MAVVTVIRLLSMLAVHGGRQLGELQATKHHHEQPREDGKVESTKIEPILTLFFNW